MNFSLLGFFKKRKLFTSLVFVFSLFILILPLSAEANFSWDLFGIVSGAMNIFSNAIVMVVFAVLTALTAPFMEFAQQIFQWVISDSFIGVSFTGPDNFIVQEGWTMMRNFSMSFIILGLVYIGLATALSLANFKTKQALFRIIVVALLINFTPALCGIIIDGANVVTRIFLPETTTLLSGMGGEIASQFATLTGGGLTADPAIALAKGLLLVVFNFVAMFIYLIFAFLFAMRYVILWLLIIISPLAFLLWIFPFGQKHFQRWWKEFINWSIIGIPAALVIYLSDKLIEETVSRPTTNMVLNNTAGSNFMTTVAQYSVPMIFLIAGFLFTLQVSATGSNLVVSRAKAIGNRGKGVLKKGLKAGGVGTVRRTTGAIVGIKQGAAEGRQLRKSGDAGFGAGTGHAIMGGARGVFTRSGVARGEEAIEKMSMEEGKGFGGYAKRLTGRTVSSMTTTSRGKALQVAMEKAKGKTTNENVSRFNSAINPMAQLAIVASEIKDGNFEQFKKNSSLDDVGVEKLYRTAIQAKGNKTAKETAKALEELYAGELGEMFGRIAQETGAYTKEQQAEDRAGKGYNSYTDRIVDKAGDTDAIKRLSSSIASSSVQSAIHEFWGGNQWAKAAETMGHKFSNAIQAAPPKTTDFYTDINKNTGRPRNSSLAFYRQSTAAARSGIGLRDGKSAVEIQKSLDESLKKVGKIVNGLVLSKGMQDRAREKGGFIQSGPSLAKQKREKVRGQAKLKKQLNRQRKKIRSGTRGRNRL
jgi:hypothetical protein